MYLVVSAVFSASVGVLTTLLVCLHVLFFVVW